jgi:hypothetical protein
LQYFARSFALPVAVALIKAEVLGSVRSKQILYGFAYHPQALIVDLLSDFKKHEYKRIGGMSFRI